MNAASSYVLQDVVDLAVVNGDTAPALATGGFSQQPATQIGNMVMQAILLGGPGGQPCNWKFNRFNVTPFPTISWQQDYFVPGIVTLGWLESAWGIQYTNSSQPKPKFALEVKRDLMVTFQQTGYPGKICQMPNSLLQTGTWGDTELQTPTGQNNPGPGVLYVNPITSVNQPNNPSTAIADPNGGLWALTTYGTCGTFNPFALGITATSMNGSNVLTVTCPNTVQIGQSVLLTGTQEAFLNGQSVTVASLLGSSPNQTGFTATGITHATYSNPSDTGTAYINTTYPTLTDPSIAATTIVDGTVVWTAVNPDGQGFRLNPIPPQQGVVWQINPVGQNRILQFTSLTQSLAPLPDDYFPYFVDGFFAQCYRRNPDPKIRARFPQEWANWLRSLDMAVRQEQREETDFGFVPTSAILETGFGGYYGPAWPFAGAPWGMW